MRSLHLQRYYLRISFSNSAVESLLHLQRCAVSFYFSFSAVQLLLWHACTQVHSCARFAPAAVQCSAPALCDARTATVTVLPRSRHLYPRTLQLAFLLAIHRRYSLHCSDFTLSLSLSFPLLLVIAVHQPAHPTAPGSFDHNKNQPCASRVATRGQ